MSNNHHLEMMILQFPVHRKPKWPQSLRLSASSMQPAELNYEIYDKELSAILQDFQQWCNYLEGSAPYDLLILCLILVPKPSLSDQSYI